MYKNNLIPPVLPPKSLNSSTYNGNRNNTNENNNKKPKKSKNPNNQKKHFKDLFDKSVKTTKHV